MYVDEYKKTVSKARSVIFSSLSDDSSIDKIKGLKSYQVKREVPHHREFQPKDFKDCFVIFDDTDCLTDKRFRLRKLIGSVELYLLETGRHYEHERSGNKSFGYRRTQLRSVYLNECKSVVIFPSGLGGRSIKYLLDNYFGLDREQIKRIKKLNSRWVCINKGFPMSVVADKEAYVLNDADDDED